jgi:hypothetical protein
MVQGIGPLLQENLGNKYEIVSIFNPNATPANVIENLCKLSKGLTK